MKIRTKLYASAILYIGLISLLALLLIFFSSRGRKESDKLELVNEFAEGIAGLGILTDEYIVYKEKRMEQQWQWRYRTISEILEKAEELIDLNIIRSAFESLNKSFSFLKTNYRERQEPLRKNAPKEEMERIIILEERTAARMRMETQKLITLAFDVAENSRQKADAIQQKANSILLFLTISLILFIATITVRVVGSITKSINELITGAKRIGRGQLDHHIRVTAKDETAVLANTFNKMTKKMIGMIETEREYTLKLEKEIVERKQIQEELRKAHDELEVKVAERTAELAQANIRLQELDRLKSIFLASTSHELRTPLNSIIGFTGIMLQGMSGEITEEQRKQLAMVKNSANHLLSLINDILDISKIEAEKVELMIKEFSLNTVVREVVEAFSPMAREKGLELLTEVPEGIMLFSDRRRIKQVLMNLVSNAVKFTVQGSVNIATRVPGDDNLEIRVIDTGIGIKQDDIDKLFAPFQQIDVSLTKKHEGTGLGLHLTKKLGALLGGDISAKSEYGRGSEFTFTIPLRYKEEN